jgi:hypothetical protein
MGMDVSECVVARTRANTLVSLQQAVSCPPALSVKDVCDCALLCILLVSIHHRVHCGWDDIQVRGALSPADELAYIVAHSGSSGLVVQDADTLHKVWPLLQQVSVGIHGCGSHMANDLCSCCSLVKVPGGGLHNTQQTGSALGRAACQHRTSCCVCATCHCTVRTHQLPVLLGHQGGHTGDGKLHNRAGWHRSK